MMKLIYQNNKLCLHFPYEEEMIDRVKSIPGAKWNKKNKVWEYPATIVCYQNLKNEFGISIKELEKNKKIKLNNYEFKTKPFKHQLEALKFIMNYFIQYDGLNKGVSLFMDMGTGKTKTIIDTAEILYANNFVKNILVICPLSITDTWHNELKIHSSYSLWDILVGNKNKRIELLENLYNTKKFLNWHIINIDGIQVIKNELANKKFDMVIIDESTIIKNRTAERTKLVIGLFDNVKYKIIMTGNPVPKSLNEIFSQYKFLDAGIFGSSYYGFVDKYCEVDYFNKVTSLKNDKEFQNKLHSVAFRKTKQECLDLPPKMYEKIKIEMSDKQKKIYEEMKKDAITAYEDATCAAPVVITKFLRLSQIAGGIFPGEGSNIKLIIPNPKLETLIEIISGIQNNEQIVIWARFNKEIEFIKERLDKEKISCVTFYGKTEQKNRAEFLQKFKNKEVRVFIGNPATGGRGINELVGATTVIYYSNDYSTENRQQSEARNYRQGSKSKVTYIDLLMKNTIDEAVLKTLQDEMDFSDMILARKVSF